MSATNTVPMGQKIAFGIGMLANQMFPAAMSIFMVVLVQDLGFPGWMWGSFSSRRAPLIALWTQSWASFLTTQEVHGDAVDNMSSGVPY